jgi:hypothetical protein
MSDEPIDPKQVNIFGGRVNKLVNTPSRLLKRRIIKQNEAPITRVMTIGGDNLDDNLQPPSIILEREGDKITRIIVKCACGRHAELSCEEEEEEEEKR